MVVDPQLHKDQVGLYHGMLRVDQLMLLSYNIEDSFQDNEKAEVVLMDLTGIYDTVFPMVSILSSYR